MANHVSSYISILQISPKGQQVWNGICEKIKSGPEQYGQYHLGYLFSDDDEEHTLTNMCEWVGAKWAYAEDMDDLSMHIQSAWSPCREFVESLVDRISEVDESVIIEYSYQDEMPNFIGVEVYDADGLYDSEEMDWDDILSEMFEHYPDLKEQWDEEEEEWNDEGEMLQEYLWEWVHEWCFLASERMTHPNFTPPEIPKDAPPDQPAPVEVPEEQSS